MTSAWDNDREFREFNKSDKSQKPKIAIAIPYIGRWEPEWVLKVYIPLACHAIPWCDKIPLLCKVPSVGVARDTLVKNSIDLGCSHIFFIDTDNIFEKVDANTGLRMLYQSMVNANNNLNKDVKIVSGLYRAKQKTGYSWAMWSRVVTKDEKGNEKIGFVAIPEWTGNWFHVDVAGMGCCLIDLDIFNHLEKPWFRWEAKDEMSEDFYFYSLAAKHGYKTWIFSDVKLAHLGGLKVNSDGTITTPDM